FEDKDVSSILTPRVDIVGFDLRDSDEAIRALFARTPFSILRVYDEDVDNVVETFHVKYFYLYLKANVKSRLKFKSFDNLLTKPLFVPPTMALSDLLTSMQQAYTHIGIVVDEHGGIIGIVTMEDALEELVGEIWDESDVVRSEVKRLNNKD